VGKSTDAAISSGVYWGTLGALRELVIQMSKSCPTVPEKFLSGAGAIWAEHLVQDGFEQVSDLVLTGVVLSGIHGVIREQAKQDG
jgi:pantothenate kinase type III